MKRPGIISFFMLHGEDPDKLKKYLLLYDELWIPWLESTYPRTEEIEFWGEELVASIDYLKREELLRPPPVDVERPLEDEVVRLFLDLIGREYKKAKRSYRTHEQAARAGAAASFNLDMLLTRLRLYLLERDQGELGYPVHDPFHFEKKMAMPDELSQRRNVLSVVLKRFPTPSPKVPLEDIVAFKRDPDTQRSFAAFWRWTRTMSERSSSAREIEEELDGLLSDYSDHLNQLTSETRYQRLEILLNTPMEIIEDLAKLRLGKLGSTLLQLHKTQILAHREEMKLPGREIAYVLKASKLISGT